MKDSDWICKQCGSDDIVATVTIRHHEISGRVRERDGKPYFDESFIDVCADDFDVDDYICECGASHWKLEELVVRRRAFNELRLSCGRCDHAAHHHEQVGIFGSHDSRFTRPPMPCTVPGCDCHDYYDTALGLEPNWNPPQNEQLAVAA